MGSLRKISTCGGENNCLTPICQIEFIYRIKAIGLNPASTEKILATANEVLQTEEPADIRQ